MLLVVLFALHFLVCLALCAVLIIQVWLLNLIEGPRWFAICEKCFRLRSIFLTEGICFPHYGQIPLIKKDMWVNRAGYHIYIYIYISIYIHVYTNMDLFQSVYHE